MAGHSGTTCSFWRLPGTCRKHFQLQRKTTQSVEFHSRSLGLLIMMSPPSSLSNPQRDFISGVNQQSCRPCPHVQGHFGKHDFFLWPFVHKQTKFTATKKPSFCKTPSKVKTFRDCRQGKVLQHAGLRAVSMLFL